MYISGFNKIFNTTERKKDYSEAFGNFWIGYVPEVNEVYYFQYKGK